MITQEYSPGDKVQANREITNKGIAKGDIYTVEEAYWIDSELYFTLKNGIQYVFFSCENCWDKVATS